MDKVRKITFICVCVSMVSVIAICTFLRVDTKMTLYGVVNEVKTPELSWKTVWNGAYQTQVDEWYKVNFPLRPWFVRVNNQAAYAIGATINDVIIVGKDGWFYTEEYASTMLTNVTEHNKERLTEYAAKVAQLRAKLEAAGKQLVYIITPSKTEVYPENLPERYKVLVQQRKNIQNNYDFLKEQLILQGVPYIDMTTILKENKGEIPFFSKTGIHWNYYAAALCAKEVVQAVGDTGTMNINVIERQEPYGTEQDVYLLSNILKGQTDDAYYAVEVDFTNASEARLKNVLEMGTSFSGELEREFFYNGLCVWNQYTRYQYFTGKTTSKGEPAPYVVGEYYNENLKADIANADVIMIENNNSYVPDSHYMFVDYILGMTDEELVNTQIVNLEEGQLCIDFALNGNADAYIRSGFYQAEEAGRWATAKTELCVELYAAQDLVLEFENCRMYANTKVLINDTVIWQTEQATDFLPEICVPLNLLNNNDVNIITIITNERVQSPKEMGTGEDSREMAQWIGKVILRADSKGGL